MDFNQNFEEHSRWRRGFSSALQDLANWLKSHELLDASVAHRIESLNRRVADDKVMLAFVAEFSRGKSELINALFFADYGRRIMPATAGRTTMCPTELGYDSDIPPCLRLLPIRSKLQTRSLADWRSLPEEWETLELDVNEGDALAASLARAAEVDRVTLDEAHRLGFWQADGAAEEAMVGQDGLVEVPRWRHALINIAHPLLKQGLIILDTPGLNAIGAEPELTVSLLPQAHAVIFILGADTGVTQSDLRIWNEHLSASGAPGKGRLVVLNKIDTLWDELSSADAIAYQIRKQRENSASILSIGAEHVLAVSAQKGLVAKIHGDAELLAASHLLDLEQVLVREVIGKRRELLSDTLTQGLGSVVAQVDRALNARTRDLLEQIQELESLKGKNTSVIKHMRLRIEQEQQEFEYSGGRIQAVKTVHLKLLAKLYEALGHAQVGQAVAQLTRQLKEPGLKLGVRKTYALTFDELRRLFEQADETSREIAAMLTGSFGQLNAEFGMTLQLGPVPDLNKFKRQLSEIEHDHVQYLGVGHTFKLTRPEFCDRLGRALLARLREIYEAAASELEVWNKAAALQLDAQLRERRHNFSRRVEAVIRIQDAAGGLEERMAELSAQSRECATLHQRLQAGTQTMVGASPSFG